VSADGRHGAVNAARLRHVGLFADLTDELLAQIAPRFTSEYYAAGHTVFEQGDIGDRFYLIARGRVRVIAVDERGGEHLVGLLEDGDHFGEIALRRDTPRTATIRTVSDCLLLTMGRERFIELVEQTPQMSTLLDRSQTQREVDLARLHRLIAEQDQPSAG
jgi:ATP-binding cassette subfamily B protein